MANTVEKRTKDGRRFYELRAHSKEKGRYYTRRWYVPLGWGSRTIAAELHKQAVNFQNEVDAGLVLSKKEQADAARIAQEKAAAEAARLKTVRQYAENVFMPAKELSIAENTRLSYQSNLDHHILPRLGDLPMKDVTPAMISKLLFDFQKDHSHGSAVKLYNVLNGMFDMALFDDTIPISPMHKVKRPKQKKDERAPLSISPQTPERVGVNCAACNGRILTLTPDLSALNVISNFRKTKVSMRPHRKADAFARSILGRT